MSTAEKYIRIEEAGSSPTGKTFRWRVRNIRSDEICGVIKWHGAFRSYCFFPPDGFLYDHSCLQVIADFLVQVNAAQRTKKTP